MTKLIVRLGVSRPRERKVSEDNVEFTTDVRSADFAYPNRAVVARKDIDPALLERWEAVGVVKPHEYLEETGTASYDIGQVVDSEELAAGYDLGTLIAKGIVEPLEPLAPAPAKTLPAGDEPKTAPKKRGRPRKKKDAE